MTSLSLYLLNDLLIFVESFTLYQLGNCFFPYRGKRRMLPLYLVLMTLTTIVGVLLANGIFPLKYALLVSASTFWVHHLYKVHPAKCLAVAAFYSSLMVLGDSLFVVGFSLLFHTDASTYLQNPYSYYGFCFAAKIFVLLFVAILRMILHARTSYTAATKQDWLRVLIFPLMSTVIVIILVQLATQQPDAAPPVMFCALLLLLADMLTIVLLNYLEQQNEAMKDYSILQHSLKLEHDNVEAWQNAYASQRKQTHDYQNQLLTIRGLAQNENCSSELIEYVSQLMQTDMTDAMLVQTGRSVVDVILNQKHALAQSKGIELKAHLDDLREFALPDEALVVVLSNLIDNAIEACEKNQAPEHKTILLRMNADPIANFLYIENYSEEPVKIVDNHILSTKPDRFAHGYGTKNIAAIMEQYGAEYVWDYDEATQEFAFSAQLIPPDAE